MTGMPPRRRWTEDEERWLSANYNALGASECARRLGRTKHATYKRAEGLGVAGSKSPPVPSGLTAERADELRRIYQTGRPPAGAVPDLARRWGFSAETVRKWARDLGLVVPRGNPAGDGRWTEEEDALIEATMHLSPESVSARLKRRGYNRTIPAVRKRRNDLRLRPDDAGYYSANQMAEALGIKHNTVYRAIERGDIKAVQRATENRTVVYYIHHKAIRRWVMTYPNRINRHQVDLVWLVDLLANGGKS